ncbi:hypothetical protein [Clostridium butyricum]|uniref:hypothetical protein n=1 Tax=Clostridium butyricum TaxID=1492 RepID=UPI0005EB2A91|nr:hypothetical protein [Clostridium butyricum]MCQ2019637.1 hypothetical protein [Clostridium butyricum]MCQ2023248.1 hypothetical protein [Clostridium butyricum]NFB72664.1 hypothetical protein [Clostridium butyricum]NFB91456.1 hypothetical protein [Clostridium butyricum]UTY53506.1 hypothetical protein HNS01_10535 [Clostridium butyricum]
MSRVADATIKGFLYQFNLTLKKVLESSEYDKIQVEGIVEDIDVVSNSNKITAIQCKYHESQKEFQLSTIYKPILQMLKHYTLNPNEDIEYILYSYFPSLDEGRKEITEENIREILATTNIDYICNYIAYIKPCDDPNVKELIKKKSKSSTDKKIIKEYYEKDNLDTICDIEIFLRDKFNFEIGKQYNRLEEDIKRLLEKEGFSKVDVEEIFYPNSIQKISILSTSKSDEERFISKKLLLKELKGTKKAAISRWTKELTDYKKILKRRREQLSSNLNINLRKRCFIFNGKNIENFDDKIVIFLRDFIKMYCHKTKLHTPPTICIKNYSKSQIEDLVARLYVKKIEVEDGYRGNKFFDAAFNREPELKIKEEWMEFSLRIGTGDKNIYQVINRSKPDDIFIIGNDIPNELDIKDVNLELLDVEDLSELRYLLKLDSEVR